MGVEGERNGGMERSGRPIPFPIPMLSLGNVVRSLSRDWGVSENEFDAFYDGKKIRQSDTNIGLPTMLRISENLQIKQDDKVGGRAYLAPSL